jgi:phosphoglycerate dehydrogenase-like enzyme
MLCRKKNDLKNHTATSLPVFPLDLYFRMAGSVTVGIKSTIPRLGQKIKANCAKIPSLNQLILQNKLIFEEIQEKDENYENNCEILLADPGLVSKRIDHSFHNLKWMQCTFAGVNRLIDDSTRDDYILTRIGEGFGSQMTEYILGWILSLQLRIPTAIEQQRRGEWNASPYLTRGTLVNQTVGILGTGQIGSSIAQSCRLFGMKTIGYCTNPSRYIHTTDSTLPFDQYTDSLETMICSSDYLVNTLPSTPQTKYLLSYPLISSILRSQSLSTPPPDSSTISPRQARLRSLVFLNIGRGDIISSTDLIQLLDNGHISVAVLDVFEEEPLPSTHPLYRLAAASGGSPQSGVVYLTPHISALSTPEIVSQNFVKNLSVYLELHAHLQPTCNDDSSPHVPSTDLFLRTLSQRLAHVVDRRKGY